MAAADPLPAPPDELHLTRRTTVAYAFGSVGTGVFATVPGLVLAYYLTNTLGVAAGLGALVVTLPKAWDVLVLPVVGRFSDRSAGRVGSRLPYLRIAGILLPLTFVLMFAVPPALGPIPAAAWVFLGFILASTAFALFQVPYIALSAELTDSPDERSTLMAWRVAFLTVAILLGGALAPVLRDALGGAYLGHFVMAVAMAGLMAAGIWLCITGLARARTRISEAAEGSLLDQIRGVRGDAPFVALLLAFVIQALGFAAMLGAAQYYATYIVGRPTAITILFVCLVAPAIVVMPLWTWVAHHLGKVHGYLIATLVFLVGAVVLLVGGQSLPFAAIAGAIAVCGVAYGGCQMFPLAMLPDAVSAARERTGEARAGVFTGVWTAGETLGFALGPGLVLVVLAISGFVSSRADEQVIQPDSAVSGVLMAFSAVPAVLVLLSIPFIRRYGRAAAAAAAAAGAGGAAVLAPPAAPPAPPGPPAAPEA
ncbi:MAG: MFS transporter [Candidatus Nanopelagicales bacterium]|jgi:Na+/melibiose symporter-like transporter|nr:MFS transporter [Candidatus Nanopelagicales bacterium]